MRRALLLLSCVTLAACGSHGLHRLTPDEYARRANAICTRYQQRFAEAFGAPTGREALVRAIDRAAPVLARTIGRLHALRPPESEQVVSRRWLVSLARLRGDVRALRDRAAANDLAGVARVRARTARDNRTSDGLAAALGAHVCARG